MDSSIRAEDFQIPSFLADLKSSIPPGNLERAKKHIIYNEQDNKRISEGVGHSNPTIWNFISAMQLEKSVTETDRSPCWRTTFKTTSKVYT